MQPPPHSALGNRVAVRVEPAPGSGRATTRRPLNKASCLSLISNAVLVWNTIQIQKVVEELRASGQVVKDEDLARVSPLHRSHVVPNGSYDLSVR